MRLENRNRATEDGAFMEPRGCNRSQSAAHRRSAKAAEQAETVAVGCDQLPSGVMVREGVDGSSPSEGFAKAPQTGLFVWAEFALRSARSGVESVMEKTRPGDCASSVARGACSRPRSRRTRASG